MKRKRLFSLIAGAALTMNMLAAPNVLAAYEPDQSLYDRFVRYDLCITDYDSLTAEKQELCKFIFETERSDMTHVRCDRARYILNDEAVGERVTPEDVQNGTLIINAEVPLMGYNYDRVLTIPDITYFDNENIIYEYWLDDSGSRRIKAYYGNYDSYEYIEYGSDDVKSDFIKIDCTVRYEEKTSDIWTYVLLPDDTAMIIDSTLQQYGDIQPIEEAVVVPSEIDGHTVTAFYEATSGTGVTKLVIPETIRYMAYLKNMPYLTDLEINAPELNMTTTCLINCPSLKNVGLDVKNIGKGAFLECNALENVDIKGAERIMWRAFVNCNSIKKLTLPENLESIGQYAFESTELEELVVPEDVKFIGSTAPPYESFIYENGKFEQIIVDALLEDNSIVNPDCLIKGHYNTAIHNYAITHNLKFYALDELDYGDTNNDGKVNIADAVVLQRFILGNGKIGCEGDMNRDGRVDIFDVPIMRAEIVK